MCVCVCVCHVDNELNIIVSNLLHMHDFSLRKERSKAPALGGVVEPKGGAGCAHDADAACLCYAIYVCI
jgi:hypothetical protein